MKLDFMISTMWSTLRDIDGKRDQSHQRKWDVWAASAPMQN